MFAVVVNAGAVFVLGLLGSILGSRFPVKVQESIMKFLPLSVLVLGVNSALKGDTIVVIMSVVIGVVIGEFLDLDGKLNTFADSLQRKFVKGGESNFSEGFVSGSLLFCVGSMGILGSIDAGVSGDYNLLLAKSTLDGLSAFFLATSLGYGMAFSGISILIYEGIIVLIAGFLAPILSPEVIANLSGTGGITIIAICLSMLNLVDYKLANAIPSILIPIIYGFIIKFI